MTVLKEYVAPLIERAALYREAEAYYDGRVAETFASTKLRSIMRTTGHHGQHNYCRVIVDSVLNRLEIANVLSDNETAQAKIAEIWDNNELALEANEIHRKALEYGDCYALVWPDEDGELLVSYNSPRTTTVIYDPENPRKKLYAVKIWKQDEKTIRMNVYLPDRIAKYRAAGPDYSEGTDWTAMDSEENPFGEIPVFHFRTHRPYGMPEAAPAYGAQNDINKLLATAMYTVDYQGAPQRYALAHPDSDAVDFGDDETERENFNSLKSSPGDIWFLKGINGVGQFTPSDPDVFWKPIANLKQSMAALTDTPFHFLERSTSVAGGESLRVSEAPLMKKVKDRQESFSVTWKEMFNFILGVEGMDAHLEIKWALLESIDETEQWDIMLKKINGGLSHRQALREMGYEEADIEKIMAERAQESAEGAYYQRTPQSRVSTEDNENFENRNGLTEGAKDNGGRGEEAA